MKESTDQIEDCGLTRAIRPDDEHDLTLVHSERDFPHCAQATKALRDLAEFEDRRHVNFLLWFRRRAGLLQWRSPAVGAFGLFPAGPLKPPPIPPPKTKHRPPTATPRSKNYVPSTIYWNTPNE